MYVPMCLCVCVCECLPLLEERVAVSPYGPSWYIPGTARIGSQQSLVPGQGILNFSPTHSHTKTIKWPGVGDWGQPAHGTPCTRTRTRYAHKRTYTHSHTQIRNPGSRVTESVATRSISDLVGGFLWGHRMAKAREVGVSLQGHIKRGRCENGCVIFI